MKCIISLQKYAKEFILFCLNYKQKTIKLKTKKRKEKEKKNMQFTWKSLPCNIKKSDYNTNNHHDRDPYWIDEESDTLVIDEEWWNNEVPVTTKELLKKRLITEGEEITLGKVPIPHDDQFDFRLLQVYQAFQEAFEMQYWFLLRI